MVTMRRVRLQIRCPLGRVHEGRPRAQVKIARRACVISVKFLLKGGQVTLMLLIVDVSLSLQMFDEVSHPTQHIFWTNASMILLDQSPNLFQRMMVIHIGE